jgi:hypothetical protein
MRFTEIVTPGQANAYIVDTRINSIVSELELVKLNAADVVEKIEGIMNEPRYKSELTTDQEIDLGVLREKLLKVMKHIEKHSKTL